MSGIREPCPAFMAYQELGNQPALSLTPAAEGRQAPALTELSIPRKDTNTKHTENLVACDEGKGEKQKGHTDRMTRC